VLTIKRDQVLNVGLNEEPRQRSARLRLQGFLQIGVLDLLVALEGDLLDRRIFFDVDEDAVAVARNLDVREQAGGIETLERRVQRRSVESLAGRGMKERADHGRIGVPVAGDSDHGIERALRSRGSACDNPQ